MRPTQTPLDDHVRKPPGVDAAGDVVSLEPLENARTLVFSSVDLLDMGFRRRCGTRAPRLSRGASTDRDSDPAIRTFS